MIEYIDYLSGLIRSLSDLVWGPWTLILLVGTHIFLTIRLGVIQKYIPRAIKLSLERTREGAGDISHYGALVTALAATVGVGNIVGVSTAVAAGGPGAVFWMWITGVFGIATKYSEAFLAVKYRVFTPDGRTVGGPMYVLERGLNMRWLGILFALFTTIAAFGIGNMVQSRAIAEKLSHHGVSPTVTGAILTILVAIVILGGIRSISRVCELLVPLMALLYVAGCVALLIMHLDRLPDTVKLILDSAFNGHAVAGGFAGATVKQAMRWGVARGLFSNESGLGSASIVAAAAQTRTAVRQALVSSTGTFWDTVVICLITGLAVVNSGEWTNGLDGVHLTTAAFGQLGFSIPGLGPVGPAFLSFALITFVFSTILGWSYYGEKACEYLFGSKSIFPYRMIWVVMVMVGAVSQLDTVFAFSDIANALMAVPNLICLILLSGVVARETREQLAEAENNV